MLNPLSSNQARDKSFSDLAPFGLNKPLRASELPILFQQVEVVGNTVFWEQRSDYNSQLEHIKSMLV